MSRIDEAALKAVESSICPPTLIGALNRLGALEAMSNRLAHHLKARADALCGEEPEVETSTEERPSGIVNEFHQTLAYIERDMTQCFNQLARIGESLGEPAPEPKQAAALPFRVPGFKTLQSPRPMTPEGREEVTALLHSLKSSEGD